MLNQFSRTELIFGKEAMEKLAGSRVAIFGIGGVGGFTAEALARSGVGTLDIIDDDKVCLTNINRQIFATRKTVGRYKVEAAKERLLDINPDMTVNCWQTFYTPETADQFDFSQYDYVVDAIDTVTGKIELVMNAQKCRTPIICSMGDMAISCKQHCVCPPGTKRKCTHRNQVPGSNAFVPSVVGLIIAGEVIKDITGFRGVK